MFESAQRAKGRMNYCAGVSTLSPRAKYFFWGSVALSCEKVVFAFERSYITSAVRKSVHVLDVPVPVRFWKNRLWSLEQEGSEHVKPMWYKWGKNWGGSIKNQPTQSDSECIDCWSKMVKEPRWSDVSWQSYCCNSKIRKMLTLTFFVTFTLQWLCKDASDHHSSLNIFLISIQCTIGLCVSWFSIDDDAKDGWSEVVWHLCSFYQDPLRS